MSAELMLDLSGPIDLGISVGPNVSSVVIHGGNMVGFVVGVQLFQTQECLVHDVGVTGGTWGILAVDDRNDVFLRCTIHDAFVGIHFQNARSNLAQGDIIINPNNKYGIPAGLTTVRKAPPPGIILGENSIRGCTFFNGNGSIVPTGMVLMPADVNYTSDVYYTSDVFLGTWATPTVTGGTLAK
jgi:hypothetical protein